MVKLNKIYTRTGDDGTTGLLGGTRVAKDSLRIESYGDVDELNSALGVARAHGLSVEHDEIVAMVQEHLFRVGADLATPHQREEKNLWVPRVTHEEVACLEAAIDRLEEKLPPLRNFILPGGTPAGATLHLARTICRRAERHTVALVLQEPETGALPLQYLNRLSDLLFVLARAANHAAGVEEHPWTPRGN